MGDVLPLAAEGGCDGLGSLRQAEIEMGPSKSIMMAMEEEVLACNFSCFFGGQEAVLVKLGIQFITFTASAESTGGSQYLCSFIVMKKSWAKPEYSRSSSVSGLIKKIQLKSCNHCVAEDNWFHSVEQSGSFRS